jgi:hypothetical protein
MFEFDFTAITAMLFGLRLFFIIVFMAISCAFLINAYNAYLKKKIDFYWCVKWFFILFVFGSLIAFSSSGVIGPKGEIRSNYQPKPLVENIQIETPPERIEYMDGFEPLKNAQ